MLLHEMVQRVARNHPSRAAVIVDDQTITFGDLKDRTDALAAFVQQNTQPGDRVAFVSENVPEWVDAYYGVPMAGRQLGFVNHRLGSGPLRASIDRLRPAMLIAGRTQLDELKAIDPVAELASVVVAIGQPRENEVGYRALLDAGHQFENPVEPIGPDTTAWLISTSGTSGRPKIVELSHRNLIAAAEGTIAIRPIGADDVYLFPFPLCHVAGYNVLMFHHEARPVVIARKFTPDSLIARTKRNGVTTVSLAPTMIHMLVDHLEQTGDRLGSLQSITYGSSSIAPSLLARAMRVMDTDFNQGFGMTELGGNAVFLGPDDHRRALAGDDSLLRAAGRVGPAVEVRLIDDEGHDVATGTQGEVLVRGDQVTKGYWEAPDANAAGFFEGWLRTGDIGRFDERGYLTIVDRKKDIIVSGGENISSREVEDLLSQHPSIAEVAVVGQPDEHWGEIVTAFVVPRPPRSSGETPLNEADVLAFGRATIGGFQQPRRVTLVTELPRNGSGKVLKHELRS